MKYVRLAMKVLALILLCTALFTNHILPVMYLIGIGAVEILLLLLVWRRKVLQIFVVIAMIVSSFGLLYSENIIARLITYNPLATNSVSFFTLKESSILTIKSAINKKIATSSLVEGKLIEVIQTELEKQGYKETLSTFEGVTEGIDELYNGTIDVLVLDEAYIDTILIVDQDFLLKTKVIWAIQNTVERVPIVSEKDVLTESFTLYIEGNDTYGALKTQGRNDVNILMTINPITHSIKMVSIPRDSYVPLNKTACGLSQYLSNTMDKLTHAGVWSTGVNCIVGTLEDTFNIKIDYYLQMNFSSFKGIIKALGTIEVYNAQAFTEDISGLKYFYEQGTIQLDSQRAIYFARQRHGFLLGDLQRVKNQQEVIKGIIAKVTDISTLTKIESIVSAVQGTIDTNMLPEEIMALARMQIQNLSFGWTLSSYDLTGHSDSQGTLTMGFGRPLYVFQLDPASVAAARQALIDNMVIPESN
jgi:polyisoprenyl-teichoic acid--peptidoglycan teichoic acid transferase